MKENDYHKLICKNLKYIIANKENTIKIKEELIPIIVKKDLKEYNDAYPGKTITNQKLSNPTRRAIEELNEISETDKIHISYIKNIMNRMFCK